MIGLWLILCLPSHYGRNPKILSIKYAVVLASCFIAGQAELWDLRLVVTFSETISNNHIKINLCCFLKLYHRLLRTYLTSRNLQTSWFLWRTQTFRLSQFFGTFLTFWISQTFSTFHSSWTLQIFQPCESFHFAMQTQSL